VSGALEIRNEGDAPLAVTRVGVTCECAKLKLSTPTRLNVPIDHADQGRTDLALAPARRRRSRSRRHEKLAAGPFEKRCLIVCSDANRARSRSPSP
jgi:hypothetical protein